MKNGVINVKDVGWLSKLGGVPVVMGRENSWLCTAVDPENVCFGRPIGQSCRNSEKEEEEEEERVRHWRIGVGKAKESSE